MKRKSCPNRECKKGFAEITDYVNNDGEDKFSIQCIVCGVNGAGGDTPEEAERLWDEGFVREEEPCSDCEGVGLTSCDEGTPCATLSCSVVHACATCLGSGEKPKEAE